MYPGPRFKMSIARNQRRPVIIVKHNIQQRTLDSQMIANVVVDEPQLPEPVHEKADPRPGRSHHLRQCFLA